MKLQTTIPLPIPPPPAPFELDLDIIPVSPTVFGEGWKIEEGINGVGDGVTGFVETLSKAVALLTDNKKEDAFKLLFLTGLGENQAYIKGENRLSVLADRSLADPDLGWSLYNETRKKTLRFLHDTFGVTKIEFPRRTFRWDHNRYSLCLTRNCDGSWSDSYHALNLLRDAEMPVLGFSK